MQYDSLADEIAAMEEVQTDTVAIGYTYNNPVDVDVGTVAPAETIAEAADISAFRITIS